MQKQKPWSKYEVALLIDAYIRFGKKEENLEPTLAKLSKQLRQMAINAGEQIDEVYRNLNGMHWQYGFIKLTFENNEFPTRRPPQLFIDMVNLYKSNRQAFEKILNDAKRMSQSEGESTLSTVPIKRLEEDKMPNQEIKVGKYTLESLTTGMYSDAKIVYREYIQNSVDALETAVNEGLLSPEEMRIEVIIDVESNSIRIIDNGTGILSSQAAPTLMNIGNSQKRHSSNRGFRGIGRLGGMSYCQHLIFTTSAMGENIKTIIDFDCYKLRALLVPGANEDLALEDVMREVTTIKTAPEASDDHYFEVEMTGVNSFSELLQLEAIRSYISQVAPLPYKDRLFLYAPEVRKYLKKKGYGIEEFPIYIGESQSTLEPLYKPNRHRFHSDRNKKRNDEISKMNYFDVSIKGEIYAVGWYADCEWYGMISEPEITGIRVRKGNILIGDNKTLNNIYKETRFNSWAQGEIFILTDKLIPNARRDDFEQTEEYFAFIQALQDGIGTEITKKIREASALRNDTSAKVITDVQKQISTAAATMEIGFNSSVDKSRVIDQLQTAATTLAKTKVRPEMQEAKIALQEQLTDTIQQVEDNGNYKLSQINSSIDKKSKKILSIVSDILSMKLAKELVDIILEEIIKTLNKR